MTWRANKPKTLAFVTFLLVATALLLVLAAEALIFERDSASALEAWMKSNVPRDATLLHSGESHGHWLVVYRTLDDHVIVSVVHPFGEPIVRELMVRSDELVGASTPSASPRPEYHSRLFSFQRECWTTDLVPLPLFRGHVDVHIEETCHHMGATRPPSSWNETVSFELTPAP